MSSGGEHGSDHERDKKHKKHDVKKDKRRSSRSRASEDGGKAVSKDEPVSATLGAPLMPAPPMPPATPPPTDPYIGEGGLTSCFDVINGVLLVNLDEEQLTNLGVNNAATRKKLMTAIKEVKERSQKVNIKELKEKRKLELEVLRDKESQALLTMPVQHSLPKSVPSWSVSDVGTFLDYIEIPEYKERFASRGINGAELLRLQDSTLVNLGIDKLGHRKKILRCARQMLDGTDPNMEPPHLKPTINTQVSFRCHLGAEMRVFNVSGRSTLASLQSQLSGLFGKQIVKIRWKDAEGDLVTVIIDEDLQDACHLSEERNIINLYLTTAP